MNLRAEIVRARRDIALMGVGRGQLSEAERAAAWLATARSEQLIPPGDWWYAWLGLGGRGSGKTTAMAHATAALARDGRARRIAIIGRTADDVRNVSIAALEKAVGPRLSYFPSNHHKVVFPSGAVAFGFSATRPDSLRGHEFDLVWADEAAAYPDPDLFDQITFSLRAQGGRLLVSTTPRPTKFIRDLVANPSTVVTHSRTLDNAANLDPRALASYTKYEGTRIGRQELEGEILDDLGGGLWRPEWVDDHRVATPPELVRTIVGVDPALGGNRRSDETGIVVVAKGIDGHGYVLADLSAQIGPDHWPRLVVGAALTWGADQIVAEVNNGGDFVGNAIAAINPNIPFRPVHSRESKLARAIPISGSYSLGQVHHVGTFAALEDQLYTANLDHGSGPDDRVDALVLGLAELELGRTAWDEPGATDYAYGIWPCTCGARFTWAPRRPCPASGCGRLAAATYDGPVAPGGR